MSLGSRVRRESGAPVLTDVHEAGQVAAVSQLFKDRLNVVLGARRDDLTNVQETTAGMPTAPVTRAPQLGAVVLNPATGRPEAIAEASRRRGALLGEQTELQASLQLEQTELREQEVAIATRAMLTTGDFPYILANVANKTLRQAYEAALGKAPRGIHCPVRGLFPCLRR
mgnify:CR=1 FL=1